MPCQGGGGRSYAKRKGVWESQTGARSKEGGELGERKRKPKAKIKEEEEDSLSCLFDYYHRTTTYLYDDML